MGRSATRRRSSCPNESTGNGYTRAFHFLTTAEARRAYVRQVMKAVRHGGHVIVATFAADGPTECSGLPVMRYDADELHAEFGSAFQLTEHRDEHHVTPAGRVQHFVYCHCLKRL